METRSTTNLVPLLACLCAGCAALPSAVVKIGPDDAGTRIPGLDLCDANSPGIVDLDPARPIVLLVHGCNSSGGRFRALSRVFEAHGQQAVCFNYDDRDSLVDASAELIRAIEALKRRLPPQQLTILAHSQGGLVARRALIRDRADALRTGDGFAYRLLTVSSPFGGIRSSSDCGKTWLHALTLGLTWIVCEGIAGRKWDEIPPGSRFIENPGELLEEVREVLKVVTDERGTCRRMGRNGKCAEDDYVFSLDEQRQPKVDADPRLHPMEVAAGHVEIVGTEGLVPVKLIALMQEQGILARTPPERRERVARLLREIYRAR